jgi:hypothetical protein
MVEEMLTQEGLVAVNDGQATRYSRRQGERVSAPGLTIVSSSQI